MDEATIPKIISVDDHVVAPAHLAGAYRQEFDADSILQGFA